MKKDVILDVYRYSGKTDIKSSVRLYRKNVGLRYIIAWRGLKSRSVLTPIFKYMIHRISSKTGIEIPITVEIGEGMQMIHPFNITINSKAKIGKNFTILKGGTIGNCKGGRLDGAPTIGDDVYVGLNSTIVGNVKIGNDVLIAANSFVNFDVPSHSIVIGNPGRIHHNEDATGEYIQNRI